ncbi:MAG: hypothetical protein QOC87_288 [Actinomycetota bacterium]|nr:hypothetical protein [Actinomycetota bacterium]
MVIETVLIACKLDELGSRDGLARQLDAIPKHPCPRVDDEAGMGARSTRRARTGRNDQGPRDNSKRAQSAQPSHAFNKTCVPVAQS